jgi:hypothetical protein
VNEKKEEAKEKAEVTERVARRLLATMSRRPVTKIWVSRWESKQAEEQAVSLTSLFRSRMLPSKACSEPVNQLEVKAKAEAEARAGAEAEAKAIHSEETDETGKTK